MEAVPAVAMLDVVAVSIALLFAAYESWLWVHTGERRHVWGALMSVGCAIYSGAMVAHYGATSAEQATYWTRIETIALVTITVSFAQVSAGFLRAPLPRSVLWLLGGASLAVFVLLPTDLMLSGEVVQRELIWLPEPFLRTEATPVLLFFEALGGLIGVGCWIGLFRARHTTRDEVRPLLLLSLVWLLAVVTEVTLPELGIPLLFNMTGLASAAMVMGLATSDLLVQMRMLDASRRDFRDLVDRAPDGIALVVDSKVAYANAALRRIIDRPMLNESVEALLGQRNLEALTGPREPHETVELRLPGREGSAMVVEATTMVLEDRPEPALLIMLRDVTGRQELTARTIEMDRTLTMGTLAAAVGHEINNPLAYALLNLDEAVDLLRDHEELDLPSLRDRVQRALSGTQRIRDTIRSLGFLTRRRQKRRSVSVERLVSTAVNLARNEITLRAQLRLMLQPELYVEGEETRLVQVLVNLLVNAAHAIEEGDTHSNLVEIRASSRGDIVSIEVSDTGSGIDGSLREQVFQPFFTTKGDEEGTGLGLYIAREAIESMGGSIEIARSGAEGTSFVVTLPRGEPSAKLSTLRPKPLTNGRARVLIVDDEDELRRALARALRTHADTVLAAGIAEAFELIERDPYFDVILTDIMMPNGSGEALYEGIKEKWPALANQVVFMTGGAFTPEMRQFVNAVDRPVLEKPLDISQLLQMVTSMRRRQDADAVSASSA